MSGILIRLCSVLSLVVLLAASALMTDFAYQQTLGPDGPNSTFAIHNLNSAFSYDLYLYAQNAGYAGTATIFTINGISRTESNGGNSGSFNQNVNYVLFSGVVSDASGVISGTFNSAKLADTAALNGLQIVARGLAPPPPSTQPPRTRAGITMA